jgi:predicted permease
MAGVRGAAVTSQVPLTGRGWGAWFNLIDRPLPPDQTPIGEAVRVVSPDYFAALDIPIVQGRGFGAGDDRDHPAVLVNAALARRYWPTGDPLGHEIYLGAPDNRVVDHATVVGVVGNTRDAGAGADPVPTVFIPFRMLPRFASLSFVLRTDGDPMAAAPMARRIVRELDPAAPIDQLRTIQDIAAARLGPTRWLAGLLSVFAALALGVALIGVFGTVTYLVGQRTRELGIRKALGAPSRAIARLVVTHTLGITLAGVAVGLGAATLGSRFLQTLLYQISPTDARIFLTVGAVLLAAAALASAWPAWRAARIDPAITLKSE